MMPATYLSTCINSIAHKSTFHHTLYLTAHLERVNPVVLGRARAKQIYCGDTEEDMCSVIPILLHGDAAWPSFRNFSGGVAGDVKASEQ
jgi:hypothetical protein